MKFCNGNKQLHLNLKEINMPEYTVNDADLKSQIERDLRLRLPPEITWRLKVEVVPILDSNVTLDFKAGSYTCTFCMVIGIIIDQYQPTIDYTVRTILEHNGRLPATHRAAFTPLAERQRFVFLFAPENVVGANDEFMRTLCPVILPDTALSDVAWAICIQQGSDEEMRSEGLGIIQRWAAAQANLSKVKFDQKIIKVGSTGVQCTCIICYLSADA